jgi:hypothetical protein
MAFEVNSFWQKKRIANDNEDGILFVKSLSFQDEEAGWRMNSRKMILGLEVSRKMIPSILN